MKAFDKRGIALQLGKQCTRADDDGSQLTVHFGEGETVQADLMLVSIGRAPLRRGDRPEASGVEFDASRTVTDERLAVDRPARLCRRRLRRLPRFAQGTPPSARARSRPRTRVHEATIGEPMRCRGRSTPIRRSRASVSPRRRRARAARRGRRGRRLPWVANARAVMQAETVGRVKSIHETKYGELLELRHEWPGT